MRLFQERATLQKTVQNHIEKENQPDTLEEIRRKINESLLSVPGLLEKKNTPEGKAKIKLNIAQVFRSMDNIPFMIQKEAEKHIENFYNDICEYGPITPFLQKDNNITEIKVNGAYQIEIEENGVERLVPDVKFRDREHLIDIIDRIVSPIGRRVDASSPIVDAYLPDKSRVNIVLDPIAVTGPFLTIRKFVPQMTIEELVRRGTFPEEIVPVFKMVAESALNFIVSGGTGGGKTTILNAIARYIPHDQSIVTIEDVLELDLQHPKVRSLITRPANIEGKGAITAKQLLINTLRMKPKRIVIGEVRDEVIDEALRAMNTGHPGSPFSIHANSPDELPETVEYLSPRSRDSILSRFGKTVQIIFQVNQLDDGTGRRRLTHISQVKGYQKGKVIIENLFEYDYGTDQLIRTNVPFYYAEKLKKKRIEVPNILLQGGE